MRTTSRVLLAALLLSAARPSPAAGPASPPPTAVVFENVRVFDGVSDRLSAPVNVLVVGNLIRAVSPGPVSPPEGAAVTRIAGGGRTLMPGLIDAHAHLTLSDVGELQVMGSAQGFIHVAATRAARETLLRGFTSVRDVGGPVFALKRGIDTGIVDGPRVWPSGAMISQTGGHGDFRMPIEFPAAPGSVATIEKIGITALADDADTVRKRAREQLALGASQLKVMAGGGISSNYDPIDVTQYSAAEFRAAVEAAENWGTYVTVHAYTPRAIRLAIEAGVKCIDHGQLADDASAKLMAEKGTWWSLQPFTESPSYPELAGAVNNAKQQQVFRGTDASYALAKKYGIKTAWGTDLLFDPSVSATQGSALASMARWYTPFEILRMATSGNAELLYLSGPRNPYPGKLGVVQEGALADLVLVDGDPLKEIRLVADAARYFLVVMKDGKIYKNAVR